VLFNEPKLLKCADRGIALAFFASFSALQRAEIAEINKKRPAFGAGRRVSVLFNEPKLLKSVAHQPTTGLQQRRFSALQRAEIAEIESYPLLAIIPSPMFQCSSTSRNC